MKRVLFGFGIIAIAAIACAQGQQRRPALVPALGLEHGTKDFYSPDYMLRIGADSGVAIGLVPSGTRKFDFMPSDRMAQRDANGFVYLGDISFRVRSAGAVTWKEFRSFAKRAAVLPIRSSAPVLAAYDLAPTLGADCPLKVVRTWMVAGGRLQLLFTLTDTGSQPVEVGSLGMAMPFNNIITGRSLEEAHATCSFTDPYIGEDAGYLRVTELNGTGPTMIVTPVGHTPLESWRLVNEPMRPNQTFEGMMEWTVHTKAMAENEWKGVDQWNEPTETVLRAGESRTFGFQFTPSPSIHAIEDTLAKVGRPVAVGLPGYVLPMDQDGRLFLKYGSGVRSLAVEPKGALAWRTNREGKNGWRGYTVRGRSWGRARLTVTYRDGTNQVVSYYVIKPEAKAVADLGNFLTTKSWFDDKSDPFGRAPSAITYDREADRQVLQDSRVWIAGLGDEAGSGSWLALAMKEFGQPDQAEVDKLSSFIDGVLWGNLQFKDGPKKYGVRKSVFFYDPKVLPNFPYDPKFNWTSWTSWTKAQTDDIGRGYNYPHVVAAYWAMYRIARNHPGMVTAHPWQWYLDQAYHTVAYLTNQEVLGRDVVGYWRLGMMEGDVFMSLMDDLRREGRTHQADLVEARMRLRADRWKQEPYPFGSEMAWDSTGQEEVYAWCQRFGYQDKQEVTLNSILAYDPTVPHWGYNGNARRYWDFLYGGKLSRIERQIHHYGSGLNAIPLLREFREYPDDLYLLRVGYGGTMGALSNIDQEGFASAAFHSFPQTLKWDAYAGDYGPNFFGHAFNTAAYLIDTKNFGWQAFGGEVSGGGRSVTVTPQDSFRSRVFLAPLGLYLTLDAGQFESVTLEGHRVRVKLSPRSASTPVARLVVETTAKGRASYAPVGGLALDAGAYTIPLGASSTSVELRPNEPSGSLD